MAVRYSYHLSAATVVSLQPQSLTLPRNNHHGQAADADQVADFVFDFDVPEVQLAADFERAGGALDEAAGCGFDVVGVDFDSDGHHRSIF